MNCFMNEISNVFIFRRIVRFSDAFTCFGKQDQARDDSVSEFSNETPVVS